jgi:hypothetical protein
MNKALAQYIADYVNDDLERNRTKLFPRRYIVGAGMILDAIDSYEGDEDE